MAFRSLASQQHRCIWHGPFVHDCIAMQCHFFSLDVARALWILSFQTRYCISLPRSRTEGELLSSIVGLFQSVRAPNIHTPVISTCPGTHTGIEVS